MREFIFFHADNAPADISITISISEDTQSDQDIMRGALEIDNEGDILYNRYVVTHCIVLDHVNDQFVKYNFTGVVTRTIKITV